jgi:adenylate kinase family enzyme
MALQHNIAIILSGLPGSGKTTLARLLLNHIPNSIHIEIDMFYMNGKSNNKAFLEHIADSIMSNSIIICKNYYNKKSITETIALLTNYRYYIFNLVPPDFITYDSSNNINREHQNKFVDKLLDRIEERTDMSSPMKITNIEQRQRAKQVIINAFVKKYETLDGCFYLDSFSNIDKNIDYIIDKIT